MDSSQLEGRILQHVNRHDYRPCKPRLIAKQLRLSEEETRDIRKTVKRMVKNGQLVYGPSHLVEKSTVGGSSRPGKGGAAIVGVFSRAAGGYGFVRPQRTDGSTAKDRTEDIFIPSENTGDAAKGDTVAVQLTKRNRGPKKLAGEIIDVLERRTHTFVGSYHQEGQSGYVIVDAGIFTQPILVGDAGAKNAQVGDKVVIEMARFPSVRREGEAVITEVLGTHGQPGVDTAIIMSEFDLPREFPDGALEDARQQAEAFDEALSGEPSDHEGNRRVDLTAATIITIDPKDARDFDDAISLERIENGHWRLGVHIADVAYFVPFNSDLDKEAKNRATSIYLPDRVIPMLPEIISNNLASLQPDRVRYAKTAFIEYSPEGIRIGTETCSSAIKSKRRFTYEEVDQFLEDREAWKKKLTPDVFRLLSEMHELAMILRKRRMDNGSIELKMREIKLDLDPDGKVTGAHQRENTESHQIIEEFMLAANESVAQLLQDNEMHFLRRTHDSPDPRRLKKLTEFVTTLGIPCGSLEDRFEIKRVLAQVDDKPEEYAVNYAVLRSMQKAVYSPEPIGHYALNSRSYAHFTSPIRRYPDLTVHRLLEKLHAGKTPKGEFLQILELGQHCSEREQRAEQAERELTKLKLLGFMSEHIGMKMPAVVTGVESYGMFVQGLEIPAEGLIAIETLDDDQYDYDDTTFSLTGRRKGNFFRLGDVLEVEIAHVDMDERNLDLRFVKRNSKPTKPPEPVRRDGRSKSKDSKGPHSKGQKQKGKGRGKRK